VLYDLTHVSFHGCSPLARAFLTLGWGAFSDTRSPLCPRNGPRAEREWAAVNDPSAGPSPDAGSGPCPSSASEHHGATPCHPHKCPSCPDFHCTGECKWVLGRGWGVGEWEADAQPGSCTVPNPHALCEWALRRRCLPNHQQAGPGMALVSGLPPSRDHSAWRSRLLQTVLGILAEWG
jgi:hypothetical protein